MQPLLCPRSAILPPLAALTFHPPLKAPCLTSTSPSPFLFLSRFTPSSRPRLCFFASKAGGKEWSNSSEAVIAEVVDEEIGGEEAWGDEEGEREEGEEEFTSASAFRARQDEKDYDRDPEFAEILGSFFDDPEKGNAKVEDRIRKKKDKILHTKTGSAQPMKVTFNKFDFSNSYIWLEFCRPPPATDISLICDVIRSWHIIGRLGGCNSMNMQLSQAPLDNKRPSYDAIQGGNVTPTTFFNIGDLEVQDNLARIWMDIGTSEPLLLDVLINALFSISSDYVGIKQLVFGGSEFEGWIENLTSEESGYSVHKI